MTHTAGHPHTLPTTDLATELTVGDHGQGLGLGLVLTEILGPHAAKLQILLGLDKQISLSETEDGFNP